MTAMKRFKSSITIGEVIRYAGVSNDFAAIHLTERADGKKPIVHGMYVMGIAQSLFLKECAGYWIRDYEMTCLRPVMVNDSISFHLEQSKSKVTVYVYQAQGQLCVKGSMIIQEFSRG